MNPLSMSLWSLVSFLVVKCLSVAVVCIYFLNKNTANRSCDVGCFPGHISFRVTVCCLHERQQEQSLIHLEFIWFLIYWLFSHLLMLCDLLMSLSRRSGYPSDFFLYVSCINTFWCDHKLLDLVMFALQDGAALSSFVWMQSFILSAVASLLCVCVCR